MNFKIFLACLTLVFTAFEGNIIAQTVDFQQANKKARKYAGKRGNHGLIVGLIQNGKTSFLSFGKMGKKSILSPDENTLFEIGSVSSVFTTTLMKLKSMEQLFQMEDHIQDYFRDGIEVPKYHHLLCQEVVDFNRPISSEDLDEYSFVSCRKDPLQPDACITFCHLASHSSGLKNNPKGLYSWNPIRYAKQKKDPYVSFSKEDLYKSMIKMELTNPPGKVFRFSNWGIAVLGNLIADMANTHFETLLEEKVLHPLELKNTAVSLSKTQTKKLAQGHDRKGKIVNHWHYESMAPAIGLKSSAQDLIRFLDANLNPPHADLENAFAHIHQPILDIHERKLDRLVHMGYGWFTSLLSTESNLPIQWISGGTGGFRSFIGFSKDKNFGVVILSNSANSVDEIGFDFLEALYLMDAKKL